MKKKSKLIWRRIAAGVLSVAMLLTMLPVTELETKAATTLNNPVIVEDSSMEAGQKVTWDCVWFGSYPQTEIVSEPSQCGTYGNSDWGSEEDYEVNVSLYSQLQSASYDSNGDTMIGGIKYRRLKKGDAKYSTSLIYFYSWSDSTTYHYFRYDPIKWRVLSTDGSSAFLLADLALDEQRYSWIVEDVTWETSMVRSWLNGYGSSGNAYGTD